MTSIALMYHDIVDEDADASGFPGADAALYKLEAGRFGRHLSALADALPAAPQRVLDLHRRAERPVYLTFDDGGVSAIRAADMLEERGWRGHFFVTAGCVDTRGFLSSAQVIELRRRGHVVGSHSWSHPLRMAHCDRATLRWEWSRSVALLSDLLGERVLTASVPGGHYSRQVAAAAAQSGIEILFTSEPTSRPRRVQACRILGRYTIQRWTSAETVVALATARFAPRARQLVLWNVKKLLKMIGGDRYLAIRRTMVGELRGGAHRPASPESPP